MFRQLLTTNPDGATWYWFGENYFRNDQTDSAQICYEQGVKGYPHFPLNHAGLGKVAMERGDRATATARFNDAVAIANDKANKFGKDLRSATFREVARGYSTGESPDIEAAWNWLKQAEGLTPADPELFIAKGDLILASGSFDVSPAVEAYKHASELAPRTRPVVLKADMYRRAKSHDAAIAEHTNAVTTDPGFVRL
jgi:tetratricopeptide (TPR) repeat protein